jgi:RNA polymerase sigma-70 factor (ECF subfamily)
MATDNRFADFVRRIRAGDARAAEELVRQYEPAIRLEVRLRLSDPRLSRLLDSMDICQSVLASFFVRAAAGQYDLDEPKQLVKLLVSMARNKVAFQARKHHYQRRDQRREEPIAERALAVAGREPTPSQIVASRELLGEVRRRLSAEERELADRRALGQAWADIASELGGTPQARRKQLERAIDRVAGQLGLDEDAHG